ncbi:unnamed protein product [Dibothriocephalus latus]|uniref:Uncharacterized protein n=1 Tax=Dibothriocephalus latus TaxID=60516 RepID=A0A3P7LX81_DIBLA|nr:unnamed protein product [Dibothriocephalus latus]
MGNKPSHVVIRPQLYRSQTHKPDDSIKPQPRRGSNRIGVGDVPDVDSLQIWDLNHIKLADKQPTYRSQPVGDGPPGRSRTSNKTQLTTYERSCTYRRKLYSESLPKIKKVSLDSCRPPQRTPSCTRAGYLPPLPNGMITGRRPAPRGRYFVDNPSNVVRPRTSCAMLSVRSSNVSAPKYACRQQWNDNNWAESESACSGASCSAACSQATPTALPKLTNMRNLLDRFEEEFKVSSASLRQAMEGLVNNELLVGRSPTDQRQLLANAEESVVSVQILLAKMHQHIAHAHEFCNMLHRIDESLQTFAKAVCAVTAWEEGQDYQSDPGRGVGAAVAPIARPRKTTDGKNCK